MKFEWFQIWHHHLDFLFRRIIFFYFYCFIESFIRVNALRKIMFNFSFIFPTEK